MWLVVCGVLAMRHEAITAHVVDNAGAYVHASALSAPHTGGDSDVHGQRNPEADRGHCALLTGFHQAASAAIAPPALTLLAHAVRTPDAPPAPRFAARDDVYRLAPKTSPPVAG